MSINIWTIKTFPMKKDKSNVEFIKIFISDSFVIKHFFQINLIFWSQFIDAICGIKPIKFDKNHILKNGIDFLKCIHIRRMMVIKFKEELPKLWNKVQILSYTHDLQIDWILTPLFFERILNLFKGYLMRMKSWW